MEAGWEAGLHEEAETVPGPLHRRDRLSAGRAAREVGLHVGPLAAVTVAGLEGGELLAVGMVGAQDAPCSCGRAVVLVSANPSSGDRAP